MYKKRSQYTITFSDKKVFFDLFTKYFVSQLTACIANVSFVQLQGITID